jgi:hypothetical protein
MMHVPFLSTLYLLLGLGYHDERVSYESG